MALSQSSSPCSSSSSTRVYEYLDDIDDSDDIVQVSKRQRVETTSTKHTSRTDNDSQDEKQTTTTVTSTSLKVAKTSPLKGKKRMNKTDSIQRYRDLPDDLVTKKWKETILPTVTKKTYGNHECWESSTATQGSGYCQLQLNGSGYGTRQGYYLLHIWSMRYHKRIPADLSELVDADCSYLCHNKRCVNPDHSVFEEGRNNKRRNVCPHIVNGTLMCPYIHEAPACLHPHSLFEREGVRLFGGY